MGTRFRRTLAVAMIAGLALVGLQGCSGANPFGPSLRAQCQTEKSAYAPVVDAMAEAAEGINAEVALSGLPITDAQQKVKQDMKDCDAVAQELITRCNSGVAADNQAAVSAAVSGLQSQTSKCKALTP